MSAIPQAITPNPHTSLLNVYIQIANKMGFQQQKKRCTSATVQVFACLQVLAAVYAVGNKEFSPVIFRQRPWISEEGANVAWIEMHGFIASKCLWHKGLRKYVKCHNQEDFIMQNCSVKKFKSMTFLPKHFNSSLIVCDTVIFADKNKVNSFHLS
jgi:hypothetical protein